MVSVEIISLIDALVLAKLNCQSKIDWKIKISMNSLIFFMIKIILKKWILENLGNFVSLIEFVKRWKKLSEEIGRYVNKINYFRLPFILFQGLCNKIVNYGLFVNFFTKLYYFFFNFKTWLINE